MGGEGEEVEVEMGECEGDRDEPLQNWRSGVDFLTTHGDGGRFRLREQSRYSFVSL